MSEDWRQIDRKDSRHWKLGFFYNNHEDASVFVPKRFGIGWTLNFGHKVALWLFLGLLLLTLAGVLFGRP